ncbi:hypothetical protein GON03_18230 [Nocardioides sp. MAH-18]|uniref:TIGR02611 family protein n=1 Tax=Nocardioides agri TaxID=2682843 RepID=A0A6L6XWQ3_9ACTN|nr:PGPGW domain-containing protein [Nocardioides sp. CGMCC 1.13656]MBA2956280.1 PGPGW domain-containing protein [Nocardioides sp. CGMCC 1.13656]MVQ51123.1 hypothetical protein [Nocardioides sp. MAH-18]
MSHPTLPPRAQAVVDRFETWSDAGPARRVGVQALVTIGGPLVVLAGIAMLVLPGPGLVVIALGLALLALEYEWARTGLAWMGRGLARAKQAALPTGASPLRRLTGLLGTAGFLVATTLLTGAITAFVGSLAIF